MPSDDASEEQGETQSAQSRYWLTNDVAALFLVVSGMVIIGLNAYGTLDLSAVPAEIRVGVFVPAVGIAVAWLFGGGAVKAWKNLSGGE